MKFWKLHSAVGFLLESTGNFWCNRPDYENNDYEPKNEDIGDLSVYTNHKYMVEDHVTVGGTNSGGKQVKMVLSILSCCRRLVKW